MVQATDYGVWGDVMREQKSDESVYRFGYQGQFAEKDEETGWSHFELREYDAVIGRWMAPDPYRQHWSPYLAMGNSPVNFFDADGGCVGGDCPPALDFDESGAFYWLGEITITGEQWPDTDEKNFGAFEQAMNDFGGWLEDVMSFIPKGRVEAGGIMYYSSGAGNEVIKGSNDRASHSIVDPYKSGIVFRFNLKGPFPKGYMPARTNAATELIKAVEGAQNVYEAYDKAITLYGGSTQAVKSINALVNTAVHGTPFAPVETQVPDVGLVDSSYNFRAVEGDNKRTIRTATSRQNGGQKIDTLQGGVYEHR